MKKLTLVGAAAILAAAIATSAIGIATPAMAQSRVNDDNYRYQGSGFWPGDVAADAVGGAVGTAGAIATAPFRGGDAYAYYGGPPARTTCGPQLGATYLGADGQWYPCGDWNSNASANYGWHDSWNDNRWHRHDSGFWPADAAADVVGGAVGTAGAIATAPFRANSYAYDNARYGGEDRNGLACRPGTWFRGDDGRRHLCR
jgi:hypothetical protein